MCIHEWWFEGLCVYMRDGFEGLCVYIRVVV